MAFVPHHLRFQYRDFGLKKILARAANLDVEKLRVGVVGAKANEPSGDGRRTVGVAAIINHFGSDDGVVPPRPFLTEPFQEERPRVASLMRQAVARVLDPKSVSGEVAIDWLGGELVKIVREAIENRDFQPNAPSTIMKKGFDHALVWTRALIGAISHQIIRASGNLLESGSAIGDFEHFEIGGGRIPGTGPYGGD